MLDRKVMTLIGLLGVSLAAMGAELKSGYDFLTQTTKDMQDDEFANPGMAAVDKGRKLFNEKSGNNKSCASCHGEDGGKFDPKHLARYPVYNEEEKRPITLQEQINLCWEEQLDNMPYVYECAELVALETFVRHQARGKTVNVDISGPMSKHYENGKQLYYTRVGQLGMSCAHCHVYNQGRKLRGQTLSQGQSNGFPEYRLGTGRVTGIHGRVQECFSSFRAEPYDSGSPELVDLEVYLNAKGNGLKIETPAVRY